ncbi:hypothetical protein HDU98_011568 [Podochytrium sp. JEL0797]|nr:hypothetical protein HDU98_011568 [Podochytrium sp. JEL0797]
MTPTIFESTPLLPVRAIVHEDTTLLRDWSCIFATISLLVLFLWMTEIVNGGWPPVVASISISIAIFGAMVHYIDEWDRHTVLEMTQVQDLG